MFIYATVYIFAFIFLFITILKKSTFIFNSLTLKIIWFLLLISFYAVIGFLFYITEIKIFLAYTSVAHLTYIFACALTNTTQYSNMLFYTYIYLVVTLGVFNVILAFKHNSLNFLSDLQILTQIPYLMSQFLLAMAAMAGLPPLLGFWAKIIVVINL